MPGRSVIARKASSGTFRLGPVRLSSPITQNILPPTDQTMSHPHVTSSVTPGQPETIFPSFAAFICNTLFTEPVAGCVHGCPQSTSPVA